ncbi:MAG: polyprenyl synthetase family protein [Bacilli bacterium]
MSAKPDIRAYMNALIPDIDRAMDRYLSEDAEIPPRLLEAMRYSVYAGGKRLRPVLAIAAAEALGGERSGVMPAACALEFIHTYSLIHDDLPIMDNDDYRRGKLTNHKVYGDAGAVLAGDALQALAFRALADSALPAPRVVRMIAELAQASGPSGMVGGQSADMEYAGRPVSEDILSYIHRHKTGALIAAAVRLGAIAQGADEGALAALTVYAQSLGLAFQIMDDLLDVSGAEQLLGKAAGTDAKAGKATYPALFGAAPSQKMVTDLTDQAKSALQGAGGLLERGTLTALADYLSARDH